MYSHAPEGYNCPFCRTGQDSIKVTEDDNRQNVCRYGGIDRVKWAQEPVSGFSSSRIHSYRCRKRKPFFQV